MVNVLVVEYDEIYGVCEKGYTLLSELIQQYRQAL